MNNVEKGGMGEKLAAGYLESKGYRILDLNYSCKNGEIDIVAKTGDYIVFVEVKLRTSVNLGYPREAVGYRKQSRLRHLAQKYIADKKLYSNDYRFDVIEIILSDKTEITHIIDAF